jgi:hypothetical protein
MRKEPPRLGLPNEDTGSPRVIDNFPADLPVSPEELDALEAFLMPVVNELLSGAGLKTPKESDSEVPQSSARWEARL